MGLTHVTSFFRASLLTGRQHVRSGVYPGAFVADNTLGLPLNETTVAAVLKSKVDLNFNLYPVNETIHELNVTVCALK